MSTAARPTLPIPAELFSDPHVEQRWRSRIRAPRMTAPRSARDQPGRSVWRSNKSGTAEIYYRGEHGLERQITNRPAGTLDAAITPSGSEVLWFADKDGDEHGRWMRQATEVLEQGSAPSVAHPGLPDGYSCGVALGSRVEVVGLRTDATNVWAWNTTGPAKVIYSHAQDAFVNSLSADEDLVALSHAEHGDNRNPGVCVLQTLDGTRVAARHDPGRGLWPFGFSPIPGDKRLLLTHERRGWTGILLWDLAADSEIDLALPLSLIFNL